MPKQEPPSVLVADDDEATRWLASEALERAGFSVLLAADGEEALRLQAVHRPDAILLDIFMPHVDGYEVLRRVRQRAAGATTPVMMMTSRGDDEAIERSFQLGATDFLPKPLPLPLLPHRMRYMLRAAAAFAETYEAARRLSRAQRLARLAHWRVRDGRFEWASDPLVVFGAPGGGRGSPSRPPPPELLAMVHPDDAARVRAAIEGGAAHQLDYRVVLPDGATRHVHHDAEPDPGGSVGALFGATQDVTEARLAEVQVFRAAFFDEATALPNREGLHRVLAATPPGRPVTVVAIDLGISRIKDSLGASDDAVLLAAIERVLHAVEVDSRSLRGEVGHALVDPSSWEVEALVARVADDELAVLLRSPQPAHGKHVAARVAAALAEPFLVEDVQIALAAAVGLATSHGEALPPREVARCAHAAMVAGRELGKSGVTELDAALAVAGRRRSELSLLLHRAVAKLRQEPEAAGMSLHYQPKIDLRTGMIAGVEALLRWRSSAGDVSPDTFIPIAEATGVIVPLGEWVLVQACQQAAVWLRGGAPLRVAVNISARQLRDPRFVASVLRATSHADLSPALLELEITEHATMQDIEHAVSVLTDLRRLGVQIALDDFGIGYSSLAHLSKLPIDVLKIDRSFIAPVGSSEMAESIPAAIIAMARGLGLRVVAEGVETIAQAEFLDRQGAAELQGYLFARPMPADQLEALLAKARPWRLPEARGPQRAVSPE